MACENVARLMKIKMKQNNPIAYFFLKFLEIFNFLWRKRTFPPSLQKSPNPNPNLKKIPKSLQQKSQSLNPNPKIPQQKSQSPNPNLNLSNFFPSITAPYSCIVPLSLAVSPSKNLPLQNPKIIEKH